LESNQLLWSTQLQKLQDWASLRDTAPHLTKILITGLTYWYTPEEAPVPLDEEDSKLYYLQEAIR